MKLAIAQLDTRAGDFSTCVERMLEASAQAHTQGVDLLVFPYTTFAGAVSVDAFEQDGFLIDQTSAFDRLVERLSCPALVPMTFEVDGAPMTDAFLVNGGTARPVRFESFLDGMAGEAGEALGEPVFEFGGHSFSVAFNYPDIDALIRSKEKVDAVIYLPMLSFAADDTASMLGSALKESGLVADAVDLHAWLIAAGSLGVQSTQVFSGSSFILTPRGELAAQAPAFEEDLLVYDMGSLGDDALELPLEFEVYDRLLLLWSALSFALKGFCRNMEAGGVGLVLKGTLASHALAVLASDALGPTNVHAVLGASGTDELDAATLELSQRLHLDVVDEGLHDGDAALACLSRFCAKTGALPLGSLDKTALALEPAPLLRVAALQPLGDVYRSDVLALARFRNTISPVFAAQIMRSYGLPDIDGVDELAKNDEERLSVIDGLLASCVEWEMPFSEAAATGDAPAVAERVLARLGELVLSRIGAGTVLVMSSKTLGELKRPCALAWSDRARSEQELAEGLFAQYGAAHGASGEKGYAGHEKEIAEALEMLRDFSHGGAWRMDDEAAGAAEQGQQRGGAPSHGPGHMPYQGGIWGSPFSDN